MEKENERKRKTGKSDKREEEICFPGNKLSYFLCKVFLLTEFHSRNSLFKDGVPITTLA